LTEDGEKDWRNRDSEFINSFKTKAEVLKYWEKGWDCLFEALQQITDDNINSTIYIRGEAHSVLDAVLRQLAHYPYHIGQIVYIAKMMKNNDWRTLSIARNKWRISIMRCIQNLARVRKIHPRFALQKVMK
jgi:hypothetical protein